MGVVRHRRPRNSAFRDGSPASPLWAGGPWRLVGGATSAAEPGRWSTQPSFPPAGLDGVEELPEVDEVWMDAAALRAGIADLAT